MLYGLGFVPTIPVFGDEIVINDPAIALSRGRGLVAPSFSDSVAGLNKLYAHFPPTFISMQAVIFRVFGISGVSLRLLTTILSIAAVFVFLAIVYELRGYGIVSDRTGILICCLYALSAPLLILHRIARMESLIELLSLLSLYCALRAILDLDGGNRQNKLKRKSHIRLPLGTATFAGLALATHPEAINAVLPGMLFVLFSDRVKTTHKFGVTALFAAIPAAIWIGTYRSRSWLALTQMAFIAREKAPDPSLPKFGLELLKNARSSAHDLMVFLFFGLMLLLMVFVAAQVIQVSLSRQVMDNLGDKTLRSVTVSLAIAIPLSVFVLGFVLPANITRYEVIYPIYLLLIALLPPPPPKWIASRYYVTAAISAFIVAQFLACILYLAEGRNSSEDVHRYDSVLKCIPTSAKIAASPQLWFAFQMQDRPFSILYPGLDGFEVWKKASPSPLEHFDVILLTDYIQGDLDRYAALSAAGKVEKAVPIGKRMLRVYSVPGIFTHCDDIQ